MTATVEQVGRGRARAYCETCGDGINAGPAKAQAWAETHNATTHREGPEHND